MADPSPYRVAVLDMQPIDPPVGGGRLRLLGLYHGLGIPTTYVGSYDWRGERYRRHRLSPSLEEIDVPLSETHFALHDRWKLFSNGHTIIDAAFPLMAHRSEEFVRRVREEARQADAVVFSHPWVHPLVREILDDRRQLIVYDSQNVEGLLRAERMDDRGFGTELVKHVVGTEFDLVHRADLILACSHDDAELFRVFYGAPADRLREIPNGVFSDTLTPPSADEKRAAKRALDLNGPCVLFLGSAYGPNIEAAQYVVGQLAPLLSEITFVICGGVGDAVELAPLRRQASPRVRFTGLVTDAEKLQYLWAADVAINPMFSGSGTNIKMFDFGATGVPVVATPVGARGIEGEGEDWAAIVDRQDLAAAVTRMLKDAEGAAGLARRFRQLVEDRYAWERISPQLGRLISETLSEKRRRLAEGEQPVRGRDRVAARAPSGQEGRPVSATIDPTRPPRDPRRIAFLTSWGVRCGIAEYARHLVQALATEGIACHVLARNDPDVLRDDDKTPAPLSVEYLWRTDEVDADAIIAACADRAVSRLSIQYHRAFFEEDALVLVAAKARTAGLSVSVTLHNSSDMLMATVHALDELGVSLLLHDERERLRLARSGLHRLIHIPMGIPESPDEPLDVARRRERIDGDPVIGTFGFLRPHKGVAELIDALGILRELFPSAQLLAMSALYPLPESEEYRARCEHLIRAHGLADCVHLRTEFVPGVHHVIAALHACDVIVLPYHQSNEGGSAAAATALAARRPMITTREPIFREIRAATYPVESTEPCVLALGIASLLANPPLRVELAARAGAYVERHSWAALAKRHADLLLSGAPGASPQ